MPARISATIQRLSQHLRTAATACALVATAQLAHAADPASYIWLGNEFYNATQSAKFDFSPVTALPAGQGSPDPDGQGFSNFGLQLGSVAQDVWLADGTLSSLTFGDAFSISRAGRHIDFQNVRLDVQAQQIFVTARFSSDVPLNASLASYASQDAVTGMYTLTDLPLWAAASITNGAEAGWGVDAEVVAYGLTLTTEGSNLLGTGFSLSPALKVALASTPMGSLMVTAVVPEPGTAALSLLGLGGLMIAVARRRQLH